MQYNLSGLYKWPRYKLHIKADTKAHLPYTNLFFLKAPYIISRYAPDSTAGTYTDLRLLQEALLWCTLGILHKDYRMHISQLTHQGFLTKLRSAYWSSERWNTHRKDSMYLSISYSVWTGITLDMENPAFIA